MWGVLGLYSRGLVVPMWEILGLYSRGLVVPMWGVLGLYSSPHTTIGRTTQIKSSQVESSDLGWADLLQQKGILDLYEGYYIYIFNSYATHGSRITARVIRYGGLARAPSPSNAAAGK